MSVIINHALAAMLSPMGAWFFAMIVVAVCVWRGWRRCAWTVGVCATVVLWAFSCGWMGRILGGGLEREFPPVAMESVPKADAIVILGGGMGANPKVSPYAEMYCAADRVWHAARLWRAGKAPFVMSSGCNDLLSTKPLLLDFGIPESAIKIENTARNTEENAKFVARVLSTPQHSQPSQPSHPRILLVTSAWHMRRAKLMFEKYAPELEIIPAACDHEATLGAANPLKVGDFFPGGEALMRNGYFVKEIIGYWGYRLRGW